MARPSTFALPFLLLGTLAAWGCSGGGPSGIDSGVQDAGPPTCASSADCDGGLICASEDGGPSYCVGCVTNGQCEPQQLCGAGELCVFRPGWGNACRLNSDCNVGQFCVQGLCQSSANATLCQRNNCPVGDRCNITNQVCEQDLGCTGDSDCLPSQTCNPGTLACVPRCDPADAGAVCDPEQTCVDSRCVNCTQDSDCGVGLTCDTAAGTCTAPGICFSDSSCTSGTVCNPESNTCVTTIAPCSSDNGCAEGQVCDAVSGMCVSNTCQPDQFYPNQMMDEAASITIGTTYNNLTLCGATDQDWYSLQLESGDQLQVTIQTDVTGSGYSFVVQFLDGMGDILATGNNLVVNGIAPATATYYLQMTDGDPDCIYGFSTLVTHGAPCPPNPLGNITTEANAATLDGGVGPIYLCSQQVDWFKLTDTIPGLTVTLGCDQQQGPLGVAAVWADGGIITQSNDGDSLQSIQIPPGTTAPIYLNVFGQGQTNAFTLSVSPLSIDGGTGL